MNRHNATVQRWMTVWLILLVLGSVFFIIATLLNTDSGINFLAYANLSYENNFAAWWSSMLLLVGAVHMFDGYTRWKDERPKVARGWAALSLILVVLSADECASIHERVGMLLPWGKWMNILPFVLILLGLFAYAAISLWSAADLRGRLLLILVAFSLFGFTALQEYLEHAVQWESLLTPGARASIEEGTELLGMLLLIRAALPNTQQLLAPGRQRVDALNAPFAWRTPALVLAAVAVPFVVYLSDLWAGDQRGQPAEWLAATLFCLAAIAALRGLSRASSRRKDVWPLVLIGASVTASAVSAGLDGMRPYILLVTAFLINVAWLPSQGGGDTAMPAVGTLLILVISVPLIFPSNFLHVYTPVAAGMVTFWGVTHLLTTPLSRRSPHRAHPVDGL